MSRLCITIPYGTGIKIKFLKRFAKFKHELILIQMAVIV